MGKMLSLVVTLFIFTSVFAHEGHDKTPGALSAPHGGIVQGTDHLYIELLGSGAAVQVYFYDHEMKPISVQSVKIEGKAVLPKKAGALPISFAVEKDFFTAKVDSKGAHRYTLELSVVHAGKNEKVQFTVEPQ